MKIFIVCSKKFYNQISQIKETLEGLGHQITLPNCYDRPDTEEKYGDLGETEHSRWKAEMFKHSTGVIHNSDALLVLNFDKNGLKNYIGGATFLEMYDAFRLGKKIFLYNDAPSGILADEINGFNPVVIRGDLDKVV